MFTEPDPNLKAGQVIYLDLIYSPSKIGLTNNTTFTHYLLMVDKFSRRPFLHGLLNSSATEIIRAVTYLLRQYFPTSTNSDLDICKRIQ